MYREQEIVSVCYGVPAAECFSAGTPVGLPLHGSCVIRFRGWGCALFLPRHLSHGLTGYPPVFGLPASSNLASKSAMIRSWFGDWVFTNALRCASVSP